jgi:hypothetical protein
MWLGGETVSIRRGQEDLSPWPKRPVGFLQCPCLVRDVFDDIAGNNGSKGSRLKREPLSARTDQTDMADSQLLEPLAGDDQPA